MGGSTEKPSIKKGQWKRLFSLAKPEWLLLLVGTVALFTGSLIFLAIPSAAGVIVDAVVGDSSSKVRYINHNAKF